MPFKSKFYNQAIADGFKPRSEEWKRALRRYSYRADNKKRVRSKLNKRKQRERRREDINKKQREFYARSGGQEAAKQRARRIRREPVRGLESLIRDFEGGRVGLDELCRQLHERVAYANGRDVCKRAGHRNKSLRPGQGELGGSLREDGRGTDKGQD